MTLEQGFPIWTGVGTILRGGVLVEQGRGEEGVADIRQGLAVYRATGAELVQPYWLALLAEGYAELGRLEDVLSTLTEALTAAHNTGECWWEAELYRLKGELLLQQAAGSGDEAETCFHQALDIARQQQAKSLELRAATSLSRLWQQQHKRAEANALLAPIYGWFTEGLDTTDLKEAKALLDKLV
jgi:predicted ATPase